MPLLPRDAEPTADEPIDFFFEELPSRPAKQIEEDKLSARLRQKVEGEFYRAEHYGLT